MGNSSWIWSGILAIACWTLSVMSYQMANSDTGHIETNNHGELNRADRDVKGMNDSVFQAVSPIGLDTGGLGRLNLSKTIEYWPNGVLPYEIDWATISREEGFVILQAFTQIERFTCVTIRQKLTTDTNYLRITNGPRCASAIGFLNRGRQDITLAQNCLRVSETVDIESTLVVDFVSKGVIIHEVLHTLGMIHEHQQWDRDSYITVGYANMDRDKYPIFDKHAKGTYKRMGVPYSYHSIMHYAKYILHNNGKPTLDPKYPCRATDDMGKFKGLAYSDVAILNKLYKCDSHCPQKDKCVGEGHLDQFCNCICEDGSQDCDRTKILTTTTESCNNTHYPSWDCYRLAMEGDCSTNKNWMRNNCARACGVCGDDDEFCRDDYGDSCAAQPEGYCSQWGLAQLCKKSCGICTAGPGGCKDIHNKCQIMVRRGECILSPEWMEKNCRQACNYCNGRNAIRPENDCDDRWVSSQCVTFAQTGQCITNPSLMKMRCAKTCQLCAQ